MKTLIEIHALQNYAPSNLNRDDTGAPKDAVFGGTRRARISSQCLKKAIRHYFEDLVAKEAILPENVAIRTKRLLEALTKNLVGKGRAEVEAAEKARLALSIVGLAVKDDGKSEYLLFLGKNELSSLADLIHSKWDEIKQQNAEQGEGKKVVKAKKLASKNADPELKKLLEKLFNGGKAVDIALFGRMLTDMPEKNQDAACQVAHAISTNAVDREFDFYTAVDDLKPEDTAGADMMGTIEFNSACFYRYAVVDWEKLVDNLQGDTDLALKGLRAFMEGFVTSEPTGKQNSFAAHNPPEFVAVSVRHESAPRNMANAFEIAIRVKPDESITRKSAEALIRRAKSFQDAFGGDDKTYVMNLVNAQLDGFGKEIASLCGLLDKALSAVQE